MKRLSFLCFFVVLVTPFWATQDVTVSPDVGQEIKSGDSVEIHLPAKPEESIWNPEAKDKSLSDLQKQLGAVNQPAPWISQPVAGMDDYMGKVTVGQGTIPEKNKVDGVLAGVLSRRIEVQQTVDRDLPPSIISDAKLIEVGKIKDPALRNQFNQSESRVLWVSKSVGRIELEQVAIGTGFVSPNGTIATNCHVIDKLARENDGKTELSVKGLVIDFGNSRGHDPKQEFLITGIASSTDVPGRDVVELIVERKNASGQSLPASLKIGHYSGGIREVVVIGYPYLDKPSGTDKTRKTFSKIRQHPDAAKIASPGFIENVHHNTGFDLLDHTSSTQGGQSGSPIIDLHDLTVVGIHFCCTGLTIRSASNLPCATWNLVTTSNFGISADVFEQQSTSIFPK
jgi:hypothetical protein